MSLINLLVALPAEAKPITARFALKRVQPNLEFPLYKNGHIALVVTGPGKVNAAAGTAFLGTLESSSRGAIWVNLGVAGHVERRVGEVLLASSVADAGSGQIWHTSIPEVLPCPSDSLLTLDRPDLDYERGGMVDMEASGFFPTACRYSSAGLVQVLKVISDNREDTSYGLGAKQVRLLMEDILETLEALLVCLEVCANTIHKP